MVPAYNEAKNLPGVIADIRQQPLDVDILVVNDGSVDDTAVVARTLGAFVVDLPYNLGIGGAVQTGYRFAYEMGYDVVGRLDGDGQHDARHLPELYQKIVSGEVDAVIGSRYKEGGGYTASRSRAVGIKLFASVVSRLTGQRFTDTTSGFWMANRAAMAVLARHLPPDYPEIEGLVMLSRAKFRICEVTVTMKPRQHGKSSITPLHSFYYVIKVLLAVLLEAMRKPVRH
ncbi:MAG: glycosyltransferase family 2 protein [Anaerolineaceae bacterium]|nr:glycosyltransferase family 2 protein [Anaerolineaceae bacterium]